MVSKLTYLPAASPGKCGHDGPINLPEEQFVNIVQQTGFIVVKNAHHAYVGLGSG